MLCDILRFMSDVTHILSQIESGDPSAADQLLPLVYNELRKLAAVRMAQEATGHTLQPTALVHEAYIQLVDGDQNRSWDSRGHFFAAAAEAMRQILIQNVRRKQAIKRGGENRRVELGDGTFLADATDIDLLALSDALDMLAKEDAEAAQLAKLRLFTGLSVDDAGTAMGIPHTSAYRSWTYAHAWLRAKLQADQ